MADGVEAVEVEYDPLPVVVDPFKALEPDAPVLRTDKEDQKDNRIFHWEVGDKDGTDKAIKEADVVVKQDIYLPRIHVASIETCGCIADFDSVRGKLTVHMTTQAPHAIRTVFALVAGHVGLSEEKIRIISPDIGGGFGGEGAGVSGLRHCRRCIRRAGKARQVDRRSHGEPPGGFVRTRLSHGGRAGRKEGRDHDRASHQDHCGSRVYQCRSATSQVAGGSLFHLYGVL